MATIDDPKNRVTAAQRRAGRCRLGHNLRAPGVLITGGHRFGCKLCAEDGKDRSLCRAGKHTRVKGTVRCDLCRQERDRARSWSVPAAVLPPVEVLDGAVCSPFTAWLFEPLVRHEREASERIAGAKVICAGCPVAELCLADGLKHNRLGVYGGVLLTTAHYRKEISKRVAQERLQQAS